MRSCIWVQVSGKQPPLLWKKLLLYLPSNSVERKKMCQRRAIFQRKGTEVWMSTGNLGIHWTHLLWTHCFGSNTGPCAHSRQYCSSPSWPASVWFSFIMSISRTMILILPPVTISLLPEELCRTRCLCLQILLLHIFTQRYTLDPHWTQCLLLFSFSEKPVSEHYTILWATKLSWQYGLG